VSERRTELTREAARLFAQKGYHGTSIGEIAEALGVQKGSLYAHIESKQDLLYETMREGAAAFHAGLDAIPEELAATEKIRLALRSHLRVVADQLDVATVFVQEWRYLEGERRDEISASCAPISTTRPLRCSFSRPSTGPTPGSSPAATRTSSPTASTRY